MNCINHPERESAAFCQSCGRPLCTECMRKVGPAVYCEPDLAARLGYTAPTDSGPTSPAAPILSSPPNPKLAALLGIIPGVGAMYNGQLVKGLIHIVIFATLCTLASDVHGVFGFLIPGWVIYQIVEAYQTALARQAGMPLPDHFGLNELSDRIGRGQAAVPGYATAPPQQPGTAPPPPQPPPPPPPPVYETPVPPASPPVFLADNPAGFPAGAIWMIGLGVLFLVSNSMRAFSFHGRLIVPLLLIALGVWTFLHQTNYGRVVQPDPALRHWQWIQAGRRSGLLVLLGLIVLANVLHITRWISVWPLFLIYFGLWALAERLAPLPAPAYPPSGATQGAGSSTTGTALVTNAQQDYETRTGPIDERHNEEGR